MSVEERLRRLEDREAIHALLMAYRRHLDARDFAAFARLFARDGEWHGGSGHERGPAAIQAMLEERIGPRVEAPGPTHFHVVGNERIEPDGDRAGATSTWMLLRRGDGDVPELVLLGRYVDELVREDGEWRFASRQALTDVPERPLAPRTD